VLSLCFKPSELSNSDDGVPAQVGFRGFAE
jgi:hypothetical protein